MNGIADPRFADAAQLFKFVLAVLFFFSIANCVAHPRASTLSTGLILIGGAVSALIGLVLFALPDALALQLLVALGRIGYPTTGRVLRYVADDPNGVERAIRLAVDPNSYGGSRAGWGVPPRRVPSARYCRAAGYTLWPVRWRWRPSSRNRAGRWAG